MRRKTNEQFKKEVYDLVGNEYAFLDTYINNCTKIRVKHNQCGHIYKVQPSAFLRGTRCPYCNNTTKMKTNMQFKQEVKNLVGDEYEFLNNYQGTNTKIKVKHNKCGHTYEVTPHEFLRGTRCPKCFGNANKKNEQFEQEVFNLVGTEYTFLDIYVNNHTKLRVRHNKCSNTYKVKPNAFLNGRRCPYCSINTGKTNARFKKDVYFQVGSDYIFLDTYINSYTKIRVKHNKCGHIYKVTPNDFLNCHNRCPYCNSPKGETIIAKLLDTLNISYEPQKTFGDLKDINLLSYDFYISDQNILIEYQGKQHYQLIDYFGGEDQFKLQQKHDKMKADYAKEHSYNLITVPYTEDTFSKIKKYLLQHGLTK